MAVYKNILPQAIAPVFNPIWYGVSSSSSALTNFEFYVQVYNSPFTATTLPNSAYKQPQSPISANTFFSPSAFLRDFLSFQPLPATTGFTQQPGVALQYAMAFGEASGSTQVIYSALTVTTGITFAGVLSHQDYNSWDCQDYIPSVRTGLSGTVPKFLSSVPQDFFASNFFTPSYGYNVREGDMQTVSIFNYFYGTGYTTTANIPFSMNLTVTQVSGGGITYQILNTAWSGGTNTNARLVNTMGVGPYNLNNIPASLLGPSGDTQIIPPGGIINFDTDKSYYFGISNAGIGAGVTGITSFLKFNLDKRPTRYATNNCNSNIRFCFVNKFGCAEYINAPLVSRRYVDANADIYGINLSPFYNQGQRAAVVGGLNMQERFLAVTDILNAFELEYIEELYTSPSVFTLNNQTGVLTPVIITNRNQEYKKPINDGNFVYQIEYQNAFPVNAQFNL